MVTPVTTELALLTPQGGPLELCWAFVLWSSSMPHPVITTTARDQLSEVTVFLVDDQAKGWFQEPPELVRWSCEETMLSELVVGPNLSQDPISEFSDGK